MADYWQHWLDFGTRADLHLPRIFRVNWFLKNDAGQFIWPGFGENARVLRWIAERLDGKLTAVKTPIGNLPQLADLGVDELSLEPGATEELLAWNPVDVEADLRSIEEYLAAFGDRTPAALLAETADRLAALK